MVFVVTLVVILLYYIFGFYRVSTKKNTTLPSNTLSTTGPPVTSFTGRVEKIDGNSIWTTSTSLSLPITYHVFITDRTEIDRPPVYVNYLLKTASSSAFINLTIKDVRIGQMITVTSQTNLRVLKGDAFEATMIDLPQAANVINGTVVRIEKGVLTLNVPLASASATINGREYRITVTKDTEISRMPLNISTKRGDGPLLIPAEKLAFSDLKMNMQVVVYAAQDVSEYNELTALRIEPFNTSPTTPKILPTPTTQ